MHFRVSAAQMLLPLDEPGSQEPERDFGLIVERALRFGQERFPLSRPLRIQWKKMPVTAGRAEMDESSIILSKNLLVTEQRVWETVLHEYAHLVVYEKYGHRAKAHGREWGRVMVRLGLRPEVTHDYDCERRAVSKPFSCVCLACGERFWRSRPLKRGRVYHHVDCGGKIRMEKAAA